MAAKSSRLRYLAIVDLDGVVADSSKRFLRARSGSFSNPIDWKIAFDPTLLDMDTQIPGALASLVAMNTLGWRVIYLSSRPVTMLTATLKWLDTYGFIMPDNKTGIRLREEGVKTRGWKAGVIDEIVQTLNPVNLLVIDDDVENRTEIELALSKISKFKLGSYTVLPDLHKAYLVARNYF